MLRSIALATLLVAPPVAAADPFEGERIPVRVRIGETREIEVGFARMHVCDDSSIVDAEMRDKSAETNVFVIRGLRAGTTDCRAGLEPDRPTFLFSITVEPSGKSPQKPDKAPAKPRR